MSSPGITIHRDKRYVAATAILAVLALLSLPIFFRHDDQQAQHIDTEEPTLTSAQHEPYSTFEAEPKEISEVQGTTINTSDNCTDNTSTETEENENNARTTTHTTVECHSDESQDSHSEVHIESRTQQSSHSGNASNTNSTTIDIH